MSDIVLEATELHRSFGSLKAVNGVSFTLSQGQTIGFIGANGAGKTTTMRMLALLDAPERGSIYYQGKNILTHPESRSRIGWMPDSYGVYTDMTVEEYLDFFGRAYDLPTKERNQRVQELLEFTDIKKFADRHVDTLSKGMLQRLCLGRALINDPQLLILDEPAAGLDPEARIHLKHLLKLLAAEGKAILISSHILSELEEFCDSLLFMDQGQIAHHGNVDSLKRQSPNGLQIEIRSSADPEQLQKWLLEQSGVSGLEAIKGGWRFSFNESDPESLSSLLKRAINQGIPIYSFHEHQRRLEDAFVKMLSDRKTGEQ